MWEFASLGCALATLCKVGAFAYVLFIAVEPFAAIAKYSKVATDPFSWPNMNVREWTIGAITAAVVGEVDAEGRAFRGRVV